MTTFWNIQILTHDYLIEGNIDSEYNDIKDSLRVETVMREMNTDFGMLQNVQYQPTSNLIVPDGLVPSSSTSVPIASVTFLQPWITELPCFHMIKGVWTI